MEQVIGKIESMGSTHRATVAGVSATDCSLDTAKRSAVRLARESGKIGNVAVDWGDDAPTPHQPPPAAARSAVG